MKWILDEEKECITQNCEPILEGSYYNDECRKALKLAQKAPEMLDLLRSVIDLQEENYGDGVSTHLKLIKKAKEIKIFLENE